MIDLQRQICKHGFPKGNVFEYAAITMLKYERKLKAKQAEKRLEEKEREKELEKEKARKQAEAEVELDLLMFFLKFPLERSW